MLVAAWRQEVLHLGPVWREVLIEEAVEFCSNGLVGDFLQVVACRGSGFHGGEVQRNWRLIMIDGDGLRSLAILHVAEGERPKTLAAPCRAVCFMLFVCCGATYYAAMVL